MNIGGEPSGRVTERIVRQKEAADITHVGSECELSLKIPGIDQLMPNLFLYVMLSHLQYVTVSNVTAKFQIYLTDCRLLNCSLWNIVQNIPASSVIFEIIFWFLSNFRVDFEENHFM